MKGGTRMRQHKAEGRISIQQLKGRACIHLAHSKVNVSAGHLLTLDCGVLHDVEALEESALLLTISWRRGNSVASASSSPTVRHLDDEALARTDNEGGAAARTPNAARTPAWGSHTANAEQKDESAFRGAFRSLSSLLSWTSCELSEDRLDERPLIW
jgi:hypothetical protein